MSTFKVEILKIDKIWSCPNSDFLQVAKLEGMEYQFIVKKDQFREGDKVLYLPLDSIVPYEILSKIGLLGKLSGPLKNRVKTIKLRGQISQGIVVSPSEILEPPFEENFDYAEVLGITKYEIPEKFVFYGPGLRVRVKTLPEGVEYYDLESCDRYSKIIQDMLDKRVSISEKMEGSNFSAIIDENEEIIVCTRNHAVIKIENENPHPFEEVAEKTGILNILRDIQKIYGKKEKIVIRGEFCGPGVQGNIYNLTEHKIYLFDVKIGERYLNPNEFILLIDENNRVPLIEHDIILKDFVGYSNLRSLSNGKSLINPNHLREGFVIRPMVEEFHSGIGRLIFKQRSPEYLCKSDT